MTASVDKEFTWLSYRGQKYKEISTRLNNIFSSYNLQDVWRIKNPTNTAFTWRRQTRIQSRLDYWYISDSLFDTVTECDILPPIF